MVNAPTSYLSTHKKKANISTCTTTSANNFYNQSGPKVIKKISCSAQLGLKFMLLINVKMPTIVVILTFISRINYMLEVQNLQFLYIWAFSVL